MLTISILLLMALAVMDQFPETKVARALRRWLVEVPARAMDRATLWRTAFFAGLIAAGLVMTVLFEAEGLIVYGFMAPEILAWAVMFDVGVLIEALLITAAVVAAQGLRVARMQARTFAERAVVLITRFAARARRPRRVVRPGRKPADDDGPAGLDQPAYRAFSIA